MWRTLPTPPEVFFLDYMLAELPIRTNICVSLCPPSLYNQRHPPLPLSSPTQLLPTTMMPLLLLFPCLRCVDVWLAQSSSCPFCKQAVEPPPQTEDDEDDNVKTVSRLSSSGRMRNFRRWLRFSEAGASAGGSFRVGARGSAVGGVGGGSSSGSNNGGFGLLGEEELGQGRGPIERQNEATTSNNNAAGGRDGIGGVGGSGAINRNRVATIDGESGRVSSGGVSPTGTQSADQEEPLSGSGGGGVVELAEAGNGRQHPSGFGFTAEEIREFGRAGSGANAIVEEDLEAGSPARTSFIAPSGAVVGATLETVTGTSIGTGNYIVVRDTTLSPPDAVEAARR